MAKDNKVRMPSSQGGLTTYFGDTKSNIEFSPMVVIIVSIIIIVVIGILHAVGSGWLVQ